MLSVDNILLLGSRNMELEFLFIQAYSFMSVDLFFTN